MNTLQDQLQNALVIFFTDGDSAHLEYLISSYTQICEEMIGDYPDLHRISDITICKNSYRVCRLASQNEKIGLIPIASANNNIQGVPLWLKGEQLREWIRDEISTPSDGINDWSKYE